jgi:hypothetical protein
LFNRSNASGFGWTLTQGSATALNITPPTATFSFTNASQLNQQFVIAGNNNPLPIKLISFDAKAKDNDANLSWQTSSEENTEKFMVERSADGSNFETISQVKGKGNRSGLNDYVLTDKGIGMRHGKVQYRLKMIDYDGRFNYSEVRVVRFGSEHATVSVQPNPFRDQLSISYLAKQDEQVSILIADLQGKVVHQQIFDLHSGWNDMNLRLGSGLSNGMYVLTLKGASGSHTQKIIKE